LIRSDFSGAAIEPAGTLEELEHVHILRVLGDLRWAVAGEGGAASMLGA